MSYPSWNEIRNSFWMQSVKFPQIDSETPSFMRLPLAKSRKELNGADAAIIGAPYVAGWGEYGGVGKDEWLAAPKRVRQQSARYASGYVQEFDIDVFEYLNVVDYCNAAIPPEVNDAPTAENILLAQAAVEDKVSDCLAVGAVPIVIGQNSPCGSYAIAKPIAERSVGKVGCICLDTHWDAKPLDRLTKDPRIAGSGSWKHKMYEFHKNMDKHNLVEIGERGMLEDKEMVRAWVDEGTNFYPLWRMRREFGIDGICEELRHAYAGTDSVFVHFDMDVLGGAGPGPGDTLGELAEPMGMTDYEVIRIAHAIGKRGLDGFSFACIPPGSALTYRTIVYVVMYLLAGIAITKKEAQT